MKNLKFHEKKLLKKVNFYDWEVDPKHENKILSKYRILKREQYTLYNKLSRWVLTLKKSTVTTFWANHCPYKYSSRPYASSLRPDYFKYLLKALPEIFSNAGVISFHDQCIFFSFVLVTLALNYNAVNLLFWTRFCSLYLINGLIAFNGVGNFGQKRHFYGYNSDFLATNARPPRYCLKNVVLELLVPAYGSLNGIFFLLFQTP